MESPVEDYPRGDLTLRFLLRGQVPTPQPIRVGEEVVFCGDPSMKDESLLVNQASGGVANIVAIVESPTVTSSRVKRDRPTSVEHEINCEGCRFSPRMVLINRDETRAIKNQDVVGHVMQIGFFANPVEASSLPISRTLKVRPDQEEPIPAPITSQQFSWMKSYVMVRGDRPVGVSDQFGLLVLQDVPLGQRVTVRLWHERGRFSEIEMDGQTVPLKRGRFTVALDGKQSNERVIRLPPETFELE